MTDDLVVVERDGGVGVLTLNRPEVLNALNADLSRALRDNFHDLAADESVRSIVFRGAGRGFLAGGDVADFADAGAEAGAAAKEMMEPLHEMIRAIRACPKPVLGALHGPVAGGGMSLTLSFDMSLAARSTVFSLAYTAIGASPDGGSSYFLPRLVGLRRAMEIALLSERISAEQALDLGLVNRVVEDDALEAEWRGLAQRLASGPTAAYGRIKKLMDRSWTSSLDEQLDAEAAAFMENAKGHDFQEGVKAFVEKRRAAFRGH